MLFLLFLAATPCPTSFHVAGLTRLETTNGADGRSLYLTFETSDPGSLHPLPLPGRVEDTGFAMLVARGDGVSASARGDTIVFRCDATHVYDAFRLGTIEVPRTSKHGTWTAAERAWQTNGDASQYRALAATKLAAFVALRMGDSALLAGKTAEARKRYEELLRTKVPRDVLVLTQATLAELALRDGTSRAYTMPADSELSAEARYRVARALILSDRRADAKALLSVNRLTRVMELRNVGLLTALDQDEVRAAYISGDDLTLARRAGPPALRAHALLSLDEGADARAVIAAVDHAPPSLRLLAADAALDAGACTDARTSLSDLERDPRLALRLKRLASMESAGACGGKEQR